MFLSSTIRASKSIRTLVTTMVGAILVLQSAVVHAQQNTPLQISLKKFKCLEETNDGPGDDEIYIVVFVADLTQVPARTMTFKTRVLNNIDDGVHNHSLQIWDLDGSSAAIANRNDVLILAAVMEHDSSKTSSVKAAVQAALSVNVATYQLNGIDRAAMVDNLRTDMDGALALGAATGIGAFSDGDERIGGSQELRLTANDLHDARNGTTVTKTLYFRGDGGKYRLYFDVTN